MGSESKTQSGTTTTQPWAGSIPHLNNIMAQAEGLYRSGQGTSIDTLPANQAINPLLQQSMTGIAHNATQNANNSAIPWATALGNLNTQGLTPGMQGQINNLQSMAQGGNTNPYLESMLETQANKLRNQVSSTYSGAGRYGGASHQNAVVNTIAEAQNPIRFQAYEADQNRKLQANSTILGAQGQGAQRALGYAALTPELDNLQYRPFERMGAVGDYLQGRDQSELDKVRANAERAQMMPWENLARYGQALGYTSPFAANATSTTGTQTTKQPYSFMDYMKLFTPNSGGYSTGGNIAGLLGL